MNKKLKSILCGAMAFVAGAVVLSACGAKTKTDEPTEQEQQQEITVGTQIPMTLADAEAIILKALEINKSGLATQAEEETNRDIMEKLGKFQFAASTSDTDIKSNKKTSESAYIGTMNYQGGQIVTTETSSSDQYGSYEEYYVNRDYYTRVNKDDSSTDLIADTDFDQSVLASMQALFGNEAFKHVYADQAVKEITETGYTLTLLGDLKSYYYLYFILAGDVAADKFDERIWGPLEHAMQESEEIDYSQIMNNDCYLKVTIYFDKNDEITSAIMQGNAISFGGDQDEDGIYVSGVGDYTTEMKFTITKTDAEITEPDWVKTYKDAHPDNE